MSPTDLSETALELQIVSSLSGLAPEQVNAAQASSKELGVRAYECRVDSGRSDFHGGAGFSY